jgi:DNA-binding transcriptional LysR family regulator
MKLDWADLHLFLTVIRAGSLRAAARELRVDASTVSRRLDQLERQAGARLLGRGSRKLALTAAGAHVLATAERMAGELSQLPRKIGSSERQLSGLVRVTMPGALSSLGAAVTRTLHTSHPRIELELLSSDSVLPIDGSQVHVTVRVSEAPSEELVGRRVSSVRSRVYAARSYLAKHRAPVSDTSHGWIEWDRRVSAKPAFQWLHETFPERRVVARGLTTLDVHALVHAGLGLGALPRFVGDADDSLTRLLDVPQEVGSSVWVLTHAELRDQPRVRVVMSALRKALAALGERM